MIMDMEQDQHFQGVSVWCLFGAISHFVAEPRLYFENKQQSKANSQQNKGHPFPALSLPVLVSLFYSRIHTMWTESFIVVKRLIRR